MIHVVVLFSLTIDADSEAWVGAWWLGPLVASGFCFLISIPMLGFPRRLPGTCTVMYVLPVKSLQDLCVFASFKVSLFYRLA